MRYVSTPLSYNDVGLAAHTLARLPDLGHGALAALAWACINMWRAIHADQDGVRFPVSTLVETLIEHGGAKARLLPRVVAAAKWRAMARLASALAKDGDDPTNGAVQFHHGSAAPDWALTREPSCRVGKWALY